MADKDKQLIITIGREYGSGGHAIGEMLAEKLGIGFYDAEIIQRLSEKKGIKKETLSLSAAAEKRSFPSMTASFVCSCLETWIPGSPAL